MKKIIINYFNLGAGLHFYYVILLSIISITITYFLGENKILVYLVVIPINIIIFIGACLMFYRLLFTGDPVDKNKILTEEELKNVPDNVKKKYLDNVNKITRENKRED
tara:strand:+ start:222 stop:545 length:324 start_codon:yes stop_codon:yes gene_type:complete